LQDQPPTAELEKGYVGKTVTVIAYETGSFVGIPRNMPKGVRPWADVGFSFRKRLVVMDQLD
jgi:hypothetical protein